MQSSVTVIQCGTKRNITIMAQKSPREVEALAQILYLDILAFFESEQGRQKFEGWEKLQDSKEGSG